MVTHGWLLFDRILATPPTVLPGEFRMSAVHGEGALQDPCTQSPTLVCGSRSRSSIVISLRLQSAEGETKPRAEK